MASSRFRHSPFRHSVWRTSAAAVVLLVLVGACSAGRPSSEELQEGLTASSSLFPVAEQQAACAADLLLGSELSDDVLRAIADADADAAPTGDAASILAAVQVEVLTTCTD